MGELINNVAPKRKVHQIPVYAAPSVMIGTSGTMPEITQEVFSGLPPLKRKHNSSVLVSAHHFCPNVMAGTATITYDKAFIAGDLNRRGRQIQSQQHLLCM